MFDELFSSLQFAWNLFIQWYLLFWGTWFGYVAAMHFKKAMDDPDVPDFKPIVKAHAYAFIGFFLVLDFVANVFVASILFLDPPREFLVTTRLKRYHSEDPKNPDDPWRTRLSHWICDHMLNPFDVGDHC